MGKGGKYETDDEKRCELRASTAPSGTATSAVLFKASIWLRQSHLYLHLPFFHLLFGRCMVHHVQYQLGRCKCHSQAIWNLEIKQQFLGTNKILCFYSKTTDGIRDVVLRVDDM
ncbi:hypothetical protein GW17_00005694 [Ensete ventricosum]|nr:hypothetical protein GW17_00005694 [Ensete ventricosum]RZR83025.1 hypothetical protein BHM03_00009565 [Ensete ventricosum]